MTSHVKIILGVGTDSFPESLAPSDVGRVLFMVTCRTEDNHYLLSHHFDYGEAVLAAEGWTSFSGEKLEVIDEVIA